MELTFPAIRGRMGARAYFVALFPIDVASRLFSLKDWAELPPEMRAQRVLNQKRVPEIAQYVIDHDEDWVFSSLTASFDGEPRFVPTSKDKPDIGELSLPLGTTFLINDGQHRLAALQEALRENRSLGSQTVSVVLFPEEDLRRNQQMFSDLNRTVQKTSRSLDILYDHRDPMNEITLNIAKIVPIFRNRVETELVSLSARSAKLVTLSSLYNAHERLLGSMAESSLEDGEYMGEKTKTARRFWDAVTTGIPEWGQVISGEIRPSEARAETISFHAVALWGLGSVGKLAMEREPDGWEDRLQALGAIDWRRVNPEWQGIVMLRSDIINRRQTRDAMSNFLGWKLGLMAEPPRPVLDVV
jgi:DNA sulfur modification protein DndB